MYFLELLIFSEGFVKFLVLIEFRKKFKVFNASDVTISNECLSCMFIEVSAIIAFLGNGILSLINSGQDFG